MDCGADVALSNRGPETDRNDPTVDALVHRKICSSDSSTSKVSIEDGSILIGHDGLQDSTRRSFGL